MDLWAEELPAEAEVLTGPEYCRRQEKALISGLFIVNSAEEHPFLIELSRTQLLFSTLLPHQNQKHYCLPLLHPTTYRLVRPKSNQQAPQLWNLLISTKSCNIHLRPMEKASSHHWDSLLSKFLSKTGFHQDFKPIRKIGQGASASVFEALRLRDNKKMAVKAFSKGVFSRNGRLQEALANEVNLMRLLSEQGQENVLSLSEVYESQNSIYLVMQLCSGGMLHHRLAGKSEKLGSYVVKDIMRQLLKGLAYIHSKNIAHRDIKLNNILLRNRHSYELVIADIGLATLIDAETYLFTRCGTPGYVAPEVIQAQPHQKLFNPHCDIFSLGVIFHFLLTAAPLFQGQDMTSVYEKNRNFNFDLTHQRYQSLEGRQLDLLSKMLKIDPFERISAEEALKHSYFAEEEQDLKIQSPVITGMNHEQTHLGFDVDLILQSIHHQRGRKEHRKASHL